MSVRYEYRDAGGALAYCVVRHGDGPGKQFEVFGPHGETLPNPIPPNQRLLYRLPELLDVHPAETVHITEGEKDADLLCEHGLTATTMPCGTHAGWLETYNAALAGRHVAILPDNDGPGKRHAETVRRSLAGHAASVVIVDLGGRSGLDDISTWFDGAADVPRLKARVRRARYEAAGYRPRHPPVKASRVAMVRSAPLSTLHKLLLLLLAEEMADGLPRTPVATLAAECGCHRVTMQRAIGDLRRRGIFGIAEHSDLKHTIEWDILAVLGPETEAA